MSKETIDAVSVKLETAFAALAEQMGVATDYFWPLFVKQQMMEGIISSLGGILIICIGVFCLVIGHRRHKHYWNPNTSPKDSTQDAPAHFMIGIIATILGLAILTASGGPTKILNPEYHAIQEVLEVVK